MSKGRNRKTYLGIENSDACFLKRKQQISHTLKHLTLIKFNLVNFLNGKIDRNVNNRKDLIQITFERIKEPVLFDFYSNELRSKPDRWISRLTNRETHMMETISKSFKFYIKIA